MEKIVILNGNSVRESLIMYTQDDTDMTVMFEYNNRYAPNDELYTVTDLPFVDFLEQTGFVKVENVPNPDIAINIHRVREVDSNGVIYFDNGMQIDSTQSAAVILANIAIALDQLNKGAITDRTAVTAVGTDYILISDTSDGGKLKKALASDLAGGGPGGSGIEILTADPGSPTEGQEWILDQRAAAGSLMAMIGGFPMPLPVETSAAMTLKIKGAVNTFYLNLLKQ